MAPVNHAVLYERLFRVNQCLMQVCEILDMYELDGVVHSVFSNSRKRTLENLRADLSHILTGLLHQRELEACVAAVRIPKEHEGDGQVEP